SRPPARPATGIDPRRMQALDAMVARGQLREALAEAQKLLKAHPKSPHLLNFIGHVQLLGGDFQRAIRNFDRVLKLDPRFAGAHANKANAYGQMGEHRKSEIEARKALKLAPNLAQAHMLLGYALLHTGRAEESVPSFERAVALAPKVASTHVGLGNALVALRRAEAALDSYRRAESLEPDNPTVLNNLGNVLQSLDRFDEAETCLRQAVERAPSAVSFRNNLARLLRDRGDVAEAAEIAEETVRLAPDDVTAWGLVASCREALGDKAGSIEAVDRALEIDPNNVMALGVRWEAETLPLDHPDLARLEALTEDEAAAPPAERSVIALDLFRAYDKADRLETAAHWLHRANALRRAGDPYDFAEQEAYLRALMAAFEAGVEPLDEAAAAEAPPPARPVLVVGMPRSGTTLVEQILASHSQVQALGELNTLGAQMFPLGWRPGGAMKPFTREALLAIRRGYFEGVSNYRLHKPVFTDKAPLNFRLVGPFLAAMPEGRVLFMKRDARATCWSNYSHMFKGRANNFGHDMRETAAMYRLHLEFLDLWKRLFPDRVHVVPYERLTEHQEEESRKLVAAAGLEWEPACLEFHKTRRAVRTASSSQVRQKMYTGSSERWRRYADYIRPMLEALEGVE
ncbi:MAG: sulfotransferase family protein, partial [Alphaproteobacteria bacterium]